MTHNINFVSFISSNHYFKVKGMKYKKLQIVLKEFKLQGITTINLNASKGELEFEYQRILALNLSTLAETNIMSSKSTSLS